MMSESMQKIRESLKRRDAAECAACLESCGNTCRVFVCLDRGRPMRWMGVSGVMGRGFTFEPAVARELARRLLLAADGVDPLRPVQ
jgi:hypothetical protein